MTTREDVARLRAIVRGDDAQRAAHSAGVFPSSYDGSDDPAPLVSQRRRARRATGFDPVGVASLMVDDDGTLFWNLDGHDGATAPRARRRMRRGVPEAHGGEILELYHYDKLDPNEVNALLITKDAELTPQQGLWRLELQHAGTPQQQVVRAAHAPKVIGKKKRLLFIHGTFSRTEAFFAGMDAARGGAGPRALHSLFGRYDEVLAFDHPTLSASPVMNAFDLARLLSRAEGPLDIVAHSRGGVVTRWLLEGYGLATEPCRALLVGCPLAGTSLASPPRLKSTLDVLSNIGTALQVAGGAAVLSAPFLIVPLALVRIASSVVSVAARTPLLDAGVAMVPGLQGQSRIANHPELMRLRAVRPARPPEYFVVQSNFESDRAGWRFWRYFRKDKMLDAGADLVFDGPNDLVVDTASMSDIPGHVIPKAHVLDFGTNGEVHHTNYFSQVETLEFMLDRLT